MKQIKWILQRFRDLKQDERAATAIEYGLIAALIGVGLIAGLTAFGDSTNGAWGELTTAVNDSLK